MSSQFCVIAQEDPQLVAKWICVSKCVRYDYILKKAYIEIECSSMHAITKIVYLEHIL